MVDASLAKVDGTRRPSGELTIDSYTIEVHVEAYEGKKLSEVEELTNTCRQFQMLTNSGFQEHSSRYYYVRLEKVDGR